MRMVGDLGLPGPEQGRNDIAVVTAAPVVHAIAVFVLEDEMIVTGDAFPGSVEREDLSCRVGSVQLLSNMLDGID